MWQWNDGTGELYHYGVKGMKWGVRKAHLQGGISDMNRRKQVTNELRELQGYAKHPSKIGNSRISTAIRNHQIKKLQKEKTKLNNKKKSYTQKEYAAAHNRAAAKINDSSNHILSDFNKKWKGKYNTTAYQQAYIEMFNKMIEDELR